MVNLIKASIDKSEFTATVGVAAFFCEIGVIDPKRGFIDEDWGLMGC